MTKVRELRQEENTLVFYIADNGGPTQSTTSQNGGLRGFKMTTYEGGPRVPFISQWKGHWPAGKVYENPVMNLDVVPTMMAATGRKIADSEKLDGVDGRIGVLDPGIDKQAVDGRTTGLPEDVTFSEVVTTDTEQSRSHCSS
jgi:arylsulfatase A-like enzyme